MRPENPEVTSQSKTEELVDHVKDYIHTLTELFKLRLIDKVSSGLSAIASYLLIMLLFAWILILTSIGAALWINECMGNRFSGFFIVAGFYFIIGLVIYLGGKNLIKRTISDKVIKHLLND